MATPRKKLGELLVEAGALDAMQLQAALGHQRQWGGKLGNVLVEQGFIPEPRLIEVLSTQLRVPVLQLDELTPDRRAMGLVPAAMAEQLHVFPIELKGQERSETLVVAMADPTDLTSVDHLQFTTRRRVQTVLAGGRDISRAIRRHYRGEDVPAPRSDGAPALDDSHLLDADGDMVPGLVGMSTARAPAVPAPPGIPPGFSAGTGAPERPGRSLLSGIGQPAAPAAASIDPFEFTPDVQGADLKVDSSGDDWSVPGLEPIAEHAGEPVAAVDDGSMELEELEVDVEEIGDDQLLTEVEFAGPGDLQTPVEQPADDWETAGLGSNEWAAPAETPEVDAAAEGWLTPNDEDPGATGDDWATPAEGDASDDWSTPQEGEQGATDDEWASFEATAEPAADGWADADTAAPAPAEAWGETPVEAEADAWGETPVEAEADAWGETPVEAEADAWGETPVEAEADAWGETPVEAEADAWGETPVAAEADDAWSAVEAPANDGWASAEESLEVEPADGADQWGEVEAPVEAEADAWGEPEAPVETEASAWGEPEAPVETEASAWGEPEAPVEAEADAWGEPEAPLEAEAAAWGEPEAPVETESSAWGEPEAAVEAEADAWGESEAPVEAEASAWGEPEAAVEAEADAWGEVEAPVEAEADAWSEPEAPVEAEADPWGEPEAPLEVEADAWGEPEAPVEAEADAWGEPEAPVEAEAAAWGEPEAPVEAEASAWDDAAPVEDSASEALPEVTEPPESGEESALSAWVGEADEQPADEWAGFGGGEAPAEPAEESSAAAWAFGEAEALPSTPEPAIDSPEQTMLEPARGWAVLGISQPTPEDAVRVVGCLIDVLVQQGAFDPSDLVAAVRAAEEATRS